MMMLLLVVCLSGIGVYTLYYSLMETSTTAGTVSAVLNGTASMNGSDMLKLESVTSLSLSSSSSTTTAITSSFYPTTPSLFSIEACICSLAPSVRLLKRGDEGYRDIRVGSNLRIDYNYPALIVVIEDVIHIQAAVRCAALFDMEIIPIGGGHGFKGLSTSNGGLLLDFNLFNNITSINNGDDNGNNNGNDISATNGRSITIQAGMRLGRLMGLLYKEFYVDEKQSSLGLGRRLGSTKYIIGTGTCPYVGVSGHVLCGGYGFFGRYLSLTSDQVLKMEIVTPQAEVLVVDDEHNKDLFWALRGSCSSGFGIVSSITIALSQHPNQLHPMITTFQTPLIIGLSNIIYATSWFQQYASSTIAPDEFTLVLAFLKDGAIEISGVYLGSKHSATSHTIEHIKVLFDHLSGGGVRGEGEEDDLALMFTERSYLEAIIWWSNEDSVKSLEDLINIASLPPLRHRSQSRRKVKSILVYPDSYITSQTIAAMVDLISNGSLNQLEWKAYGGSRNAISITSEAIYSDKSPLKRGHILELHFGQSYHPTSSKESSNSTFMSEKDEALVRLVNDASTTMYRTQAMSGGPFHPLSSYIGYIDLDVNVNSKERSSTSLSTSSPSSLSTSSPAEGKGRGEAYFGEINTMKLKAIRDRFDPNNAFGSNATRFLYGRDHD